MLSKLERRGGHGTGKLQRGCRARLLYGHAFGLGEGRHRALAQAARELMHRSTGEALLLSAVNAFGPITYDVKHLCSRAIALAARPCPVLAFTELERILFVDRLAPGDATALLLDVAEDLYRSFTDSRCPPLTRPMLAPFRDSWAWAGRSFR